MVERQAVDWATVSITYSSGQTFGTATPAAASPTTLATTTAAASPAASPAATSSSSGSSLGSSVSLLVADIARLVTLVVQEGVNAVTENGGIWLGSGGAYTNEFTNDSGEDLILVIWGSDGSWVNANKPAVTVSLASGASTLVSFASGAIGAWSAIYADTQTVDGQVSNTWGEFTFSPEGVVDVSKEVNMSGHSMSIVGPDCTTDMTTCVFVCTSGNVCLTDYALLNCAAGSQSGAQYGTFGGAPSGGCGWNGASTASLKTSLGA